MTTANTSFEHVLHNLQERDCILDEIKQELDLLFDTMKSSDTSKVIQSISDCLHMLYEKYKHNIDRFNIGIISFISDYYSIIDQHTDQFHPKYLHNYSGHRGHYTPILSIPPHSEQFNPSELVDIFIDHCYDLKKFKFHTDISHLRRSREQTWIVYQKLSNYIASENIYDLSDLLIHEFSSVINSLSAIDNTNNKESINKLKSLIQKFQNIKLDFKPTEEMLDYCECGNIMQVIASSSEMVCNHCGYLYELKGTVFDDNQFYSQEGTRYKHAGYEPSKHCKCWLERIQAKETNTILSAQINKIEACIKRDGITNKKRLTIEQIRKYLKDTGLTELNEHVALIKKLITGIAPPQLTYAETQDITNSFSKAVKAYNIIRPSCKSNILFYPFIIWKLIEMHVSDFIKRKALLSFIHLQGPQTLVSNDQIWQRICNVIPGFKYRPTDRYEYS